MAAIEKIVEGDGVITVYFSSPYEVEVDNIREGFRRISREKVLTVLFCFFLFPKNPNNPNLPSVAVSVSRK